MPAAHPDPFALAAAAAAELATRSGRAATTSPWSSGRAGAGPRPSLGAGVDSPSPTSPASRRPPRPGTGRGPVDRHRRPAGARLPRSGPPLRGPRPVVVAHGVRTAAAAGCRTVVLTNAAGSLHPEWPIGQPVLIADQINRTGRSPLTGPPPPPPFASRFVDLSDLYTARLRAVARDVDPTLPEGVYVGFHGPAVRDAGRDPDGGHDRRRPRRHVDGARGDRRPPPRRSTCSASRSPPTSPPGSATCRSTAPTCWPPATPSPSASAGCSARSWTADGSRERARTTCASPTPRSSRWTPRVRPEHGDRPSTATASRRVGAARCRAARTIDARGAIVCRGSSTPTPTWR